jgi:hypothetical protein
MSESEEEDQPEILEIEPAPGNCTLKCIAAGVFKLGNEISAPANSGLLAISNKYGLLAAAVDNGFVFGPITEIHNQSAEMDRQEAQTIPQEFSEIGLNLIELKCTVQAVTFSPSSNILCIAAQNRLDFYSSYELQKVCTLQDSNFSFLIHSKDF